MTRILTVIVLFCLSQSLSGQNTLVGVKGVFTANQQRWNSYDRDMYFAPGLDVYIESYEEEESYRLYAQLGYHSRGSSLRGFDYRVYSKHKFENAVLELGAKQTFHKADRWLGYYLIGVRGEFTFATNLENNANNSIYSLVDPAFVQRWNYGVSVGGGLEFLKDEERAYVLEFTINPDLSRQYFQPYAIETCCNSIGQPITLRRQEVKNLSIELKLGYRWMN